MIVIETRKGRITLPPAEGVWRIDTTGDRTVFALEPRTPKPKPRPKPKPKPKPGRSDDEVREAIRAAGGNMAAAARTLGCDYGALWRRNRDLGDPAKAARAARSISTRDISDALRGARGVVAEAARALGCSRQNINERVRKLPSLKIMTVDGRGRGNHRNPMLADAGAIRAALRRTGGGRVKAAALLGCSASGLRAAMDRLGIEWEDDGRRARSALSDAETRRALAAADGNMAAAARAAGCSYAAMVRRNRELGDPAKALRRRRRSRRRVPPIPAEDAREAIRAEGTVRRAAAYLGVPKTRLWNEMRRHGIGPRRADGIAQTP